MNLVGPGPIEPHFEDAARALEGLNPTGTWADLGSGAGFPGMVFAATFPEVPLVLAESRQKRCVFLEKVLSEAQWSGPVRVHHGRVEELPEGAFDGVMARAFAPWPEVLEHARRLLRPGGQALLLHGPADHPEAPDFAPLAQRSYLIEGKSRRVSLLRWGASG